LGDVTLTAGGEFRPALRTSAARTGNPKAIMANADGTSKRFAMGNRHVAMRDSLFRHAVACGTAAQKLTIC